MAQNLGSTLNQADIYPLSFTLAPGAQPPDVQTASGKRPEGNTSNAAGLSFVSIIVVLVLIRVAYEFSGESS